MDRGEGVGTGHAGQDPTCLNLNGKVAELGK